MSSVVYVAVHISQSPDRVRRDLLQSLRLRQVNHKFHYDSYKQSQKWLALHQAYAPSRIDPDCMAIYDRGFEALAAAIDYPKVELIGLGCGGGQKDVRLIQLLRGRGKTLAYTPCDVSVALVLAAYNAALEGFPAIKCHPLVCDLGSSEDLPEVLGKSTDAQASRALTFFGMIPNFEPSVILPRLAALIRPQDWLLFSANLAPGADYGLGVERVLPGYDNPLTRDWLMTFLWDLGVEPGEGETRFFIEETDEGLKRIVASFQFNCQRTLRLDGEKIEFQKGDDIRLFYSYRYTGDRVVSALERHSLTVVDQWIAPSGEEGVFLCRRAGTGAA